MITHSNTTLLTTAPKIIGNIFSESIHAAQVCLLPPHGFNGRLQSRNRNYCLLLAIDGLQSPLQRCFLLLTICCSDCNVVFPFADLQLQLQFCFLLLTVCSDDCCFVFQLC